MELVPIPLDEQLAAVVAIRRGVLGVMYIPNIHVLYAVRLGNLVGFEQFRDRSVGPIGHPKVRVERRKVDRYIGPEFLDDPLAHAVQLVRRIIGTGDH